MRTLYVLAALIHFDMYIRMLHLIHNCENSLKVYIHYTII